MSKFINSKLVQAGIIATTALLLVTSAQAKSFNDDVTVISQEQFYVGDRLARGEPFIGTHPDSSIIEMPLGKGEEGRIILAPDGQVVSLETGSDQGGAYDSDTVMYEAPVATDGSADFSAEMNTLKDFVEEAYPTNKTVDDTQYDEGNTHKLSSGMRTARDAVVKKAQDFWEKWAGKLIPLSDKTALR
jgi:hypothetical protein